MRDVKSVEEAVTAALDDPTYVQGGIKRKLLQQFDFPDGCNTTTSIIEVQAGTCADRHTHPGVETGYVLAGEFDLVIEGMADQRLKVGSSYAIPAGAVHYARVLSDVPLRVLCAFIIDKSQPLATVEGPGT